MSIYISDEIMEIISCKNFSAVLDCIRIDHNVLTEVLHDSGERGERVINSLKAKAYDSLIEDLKEIKIIK